MKNLIQVMVIMGLLMSSIVVAQDAKPWGGTSGTQTEPELKVEQAVIAKDVDREKREPVEPGEKFSADVGKLYCFVKLTGAKEETEIKHIWYLEEEVMSEVYRTQFLGHYLSTFCQSCQVVFPCLFWAEKSQPLNAPLLII